MTTIHARSVLSIAAIATVGMSAMLALQNNAWAQDRPAAAPPSRMSPGAAPVELTLPVPPALAGSQTAPALAVPDPGHGPGKGVGAGLPPGMQLLNLSTQGNTLQAGDAACPNQPYYLYSGGKLDNFGGTPDLAYPSPNLAAFIPAGGAVVPYDKPMQDGRFGDSFNLQNTRSVCYAIVQFRAQPTNGSGSNDGLTMGHVGPGGTPFSTVAQVINPGALPGLQTYALTAAGRNLLSQQTGFGLDKTPAQSVFDLYLQDDTRIDFFRLFVWYGPNCNQIGGGSGMASTGC